MRPARDRRGGRSAVALFICMGLGLAGCAGTGKPRATAPDTAATTPASTQETSRPSPVQLPESIATRESDPRVDRLVLAARYGQQAAVEQLLEAGADPNGHDIYGVAPLVAAAGNGQMAMVDLLLLKGAKVGTANRDGTTALMAAAAVGAFELVHHLIQLGAEIDARDALGETALFKAVQQGHIKAAGVLLRAGADPNLHNRRRVNVAESGYTPLMYAVTGGLTSRPVDWVAMTRLLLDFGADPELRDAQGDRAMSLATRLGKAEVVAALRAAGAREDEGYAGLNDNEALLVAVRRGDLAQIAHLLDSGADPNYIDSNGVTPLLVAAHEGRLPVVKLLLERGAWLDFVTSGLTPYALEKSHAPLPRKVLMAAASRGDTALLAAVRQGHLDLVRYLIEQEAQINQPNRRGETPLFVAIDNDDLEMTRLLLESGADANERQPLLRGGLAGVKQRNGRHSALSYAVARGRPEIVGLLIERGADIEYRGFHGKSPLFLAVERGDMAMAERLLAAGADVRTTNEAGTTLLMLAARRGDGGMVDLLLARGADLNAIERPNLGYGFRPDSGSDMTALMYAAREGHADIVRRLLQAGAVVSIHNAEGRTALDEAAAAGHQEIVELMELAGGHSISATTP